MNKKDIKLIIDMLIYLDVLTNWNNGIYAGNDIGKSVSILDKLQSKHKDIVNAKKRHKIISGLIIKLEEQLNER